jgi:hypothetical protein
LVEERESESDTEDAEPSALVSAAMLPAAAARLNNIAWKLHEQRGRNAELIQLRKRYIEQAYCAQIKSDKALLRSRNIAQMHPSVQRVFLQARLEKLREKERRSRNPVSDE